jgi:2-polyprenyl-6-hydroxyphenyl methylase/3-demethylubiquinone-9 3-methyltransferase
MDTHEFEIRSGQRFDFGANWKRFLAGAGEAEVAAAAASLLGTLGRPDLKELTFLDVGSGSGLSSLAAWRAGARVVSFDFDPNSVACTLELRNRSKASDASWQVLRGSVLDRNFLASLGTFDIVYSWGVLHHTGAMWDAVDNATQLVRAGGQLFIALYNDQGAVSHYWLKVKRLYNRSTVWAKLLLAIHLPYFFAARVAGNLGRMLRGEARDERGMHFMPDVVDWLGGYPFEVATIEAVVSHIEPRGFRLVRAKSVGRRSGCNELVFRRDA